MASGSLAVLLIEGEAGIGKTRLLKEGLTGAAARGMQVATGAAEELERSRPFGLLAGALGCVPASGDPRRAAIGALLSARGGSGKSPVTVTSDPGLQFRVVDAFGDLVEALALSGPVVIGVDDLQWADPSSSVTLAAMGRRLADLPVGIIGCFRPTPRPAELEGAVSALEAAGARHLALSPLGAGAVSDLVSETVAAEPGPGLLIEVAGPREPVVRHRTAGRAAAGRRHSRHRGTGRGGRGDVAAEPAADDIAPPQLPARGHLAGAAGRVDPWIRVLPHRPDLISGRAGIGLTGALTEAIRAHVIEDDGVQLRFRHDLIRDSIYEDLPTSLRQGLHRDAAVRLAHSGAPSLRVAEHFARGASEGDGEAIGWLTRAAREAAPGSPAAAAGLLDQAITLMRPSDPDRDRLMAERASRLMLAGRIDAETTCRLLLDGRHDPAIEGAIRICLGHALLAQSRHRDGLAEMERAAESPMATDAERATARAWASFARLSLGDLDGAASAAGQASFVASAAGDPMSASIAVTALATICQLRGQFADALRISDDALRLADDSLARQGQQYPVHIARGSILTQFDRLEEARVTLHAGRRINENRGVRWPLPSFGVYLGIERFTAGEWDDALAELESSVELAEETGESCSVIPAHSVISLISFHRDDLSRAAAAVAAADRELADRDPPYHVEWAAWPRSLLQEASGQSARALTTMTAFWEQAARQGISVECPVVGADLVRLAISEGDTRLARQVAEAAGDVASRNDLPWLRGAALRCQGLAENDVGALVAAVDAYAGASRPLELALASEDTARTLVRQGDIGRARPLLDQAIAIYERLGADRGLARANAILRLAGVRRGARGPRKRPQSGWQSLTPTELTVSGLVADGLSNPQIGDRLYISRRTVQAHLAHVFAKLDLTSPRAACR